ncbi:MAG TPA: Na+ dependent nucleoside transporter N-terminal domain-containing protein, partial [Abditibacteriaceae bacterium]
MPIILRTLALILLLCGSLFLAPVVAEEAASTVVPTIIDRSGTPLQKVQSLFGLVMLTALCWGIGQLRKPRLKPSARTVLWGLGLQFLFALIVLNTPGFFEAINNGANAL